MLGLDANENGPEIRIDRTPSTIIPNGKTSGGDTYNLVVNTLDPRTAGPIVVEALQSYNRQRGKIPIKVGAQ